MTTPILSEADLASSVKDVYSQLARFGAQAEDIPDYLVRASLQNLLQAATLQLELILALHSITTPSWDDIQRARSALRREAIRGTSD